VVGAPLALLMSGLALWRDNPKLWAIAGFSASLLMLYILIYVEICS
jgi:hypothetical protein